MYLVFDIGGTFAKYAIMDQEGSIIKKGKASSGYTDVNEFKEAIAALIDENISEEIEGIAFSCPGVIDIHEGVIYNGGSFPFLHEFALVKWLEDSYHLPVSIENDGKAAALAEVWLGSIKENKNAVVLVLGSGVGGGLVIDGKLYRGSRFSAGEVSFLTTKYQMETKESTYFGMEGSAVRMVQTIAALNGLDKCADGREVFSYIKKENQPSWKIFTEYCRNIAVQILNLQYILDPEVFAIGGGISSQPIVTEQIQSEIRELIAENSFHKANPKIVTARFQNDANLYGALYHFLNIGRMAI